VLRVLRGSGRRERLGGVERTDRRTPPAVVVIGEAGDTGLLGPAMLMVRRGVQGCQRVVAEGGVDHCD